MLSFVSGRTGMKSHEVDLEDFERVYRVNVNGVFLMAKAVLPVMLKQGPGAKGYGRICNIASISGKEGNAGMLAYSSSKAAVGVDCTGSLRFPHPCIWLPPTSLQVIGLTKVMGKDYADTGITVNAIAPAVVRTAMVDALPEAQVVRALGHGASCSVHAVIRILLTDLHDIQDPHGPHWRNFRDRCSGCLHHLARSVIHHGLHV